MAIYPVAPILTFHIGDLPPEPPCNNLEYFPQSPRCNKPTPHGRELVTANKSRMMLDTKRIEQYFTKTVTQIKAIDPLMRKKIGRPQGECKHSEHRRAQWRKSKQKNYIAKHKQSHIQRPGDTHE